uniref:Uncharacterized protein n=1 Tax=uncultured bacterium contig00008 TaxID=1181500 RepID=A0A806KNC7_9BACT|nr:hypothetical protein [uncultured bacterium contig00008]
MRKLLLSLLVFMFFSTAMYAQQLPQVTIVNNTGYTVWYVYFGPVTDTSWGEDKLDGNETLNNGQSRTFTLLYPLSEADMYDFRLVDLDGDSYIKWDILVSNNATVEFTFDDFYYDDDPVYYDGPPITIINNTGYPIRNIYISSTADDYWGTDRLSAEEVLNDGYSVTLNLPYPVNVVNRYDIMLKDSDGDTYTKMNVLVSAGSTIEFTFDDIDWEWD